MSADTHGPFAAIKRFLAIFFFIWALVLAYLGITGKGTSMVVFLIGAVACLLGGVYCARSFAFLQKKDF